MLSHSEEQLLNFVSIFIFVSLVLPFDLFTPLKRLLSFNKENILEYNLLAYITKPGFVLLSLLLEQG